MGCKKSPGTFKGVHKKGNKLAAVQSNLSCKSWKCPDCSPKKATEIKKRISRGAIAAYQENRNYVKLLTMTCPGKGFRGLFDPAEAHDLMQVYFHKVITSLRRSYGYFDYLKVTEKQKDGYPHFHVLMVGKNIAPKQVRADIEHLWCNTYGMGFLKINIVNDTKHGVNYILKYLTKGMDSIRKYARVFSSSRSALAPAPESTHDWLQTRFYFGRACTDNIQEIELTPDLDNFHSIRDIANRLISFTTPPPPPAR